MHSFIRDVYNYNAVLMRDKFLQIVPEVCCMVSLSVWWTSLPAQVTMAITEELLTPAESVSCTQNR